MLAAVLCLRSLLCHTHGLPRSLQIDIDSIDSATFWVVDAFIKDNLPGNKKGGAAAAGGAASRKSSGGAAGAGAKAGGGGGQPVLSTMSPADGPSKPKKLRT